MPPSPITTSFRKMRKAEIRVASSLAGSDQILAIVLPTSLTTFLKERVYGTKESNDDRVNLIVMESDKFANRCNTETMCDLIIGAIVLNFFDSAEK